MGNSKDITIANLIAANYALMHTLNVTLLALRSVPEFNANKVAESLQNYIDAPPVENLPDIEAYKQIIRAFKWYLVADPRSAEVVDFPSNPPSPDDL